MSVPTRSTRRPLSVAAHVHVHVHVSRMTYGLLAWIALSTMVAPVDAKKPAFFRSKFQMSKSNTSSSSSTAATTHNSNHHILIAGSANMDTFLPIHHLPTAGENLLLVPHCHPFDAPGGKGCNQAIAVQLLSKEKDSSNQASDGCDARGKSRSRFIGRIGDDEAGKAIREILASHNVDTTFLEIASASASESVSTSIPTGRGYVFLEKESGMVSAVVSGGSNLYGWDDHDDDHLQPQQHLSKRMQQFFTIDEANILPLDDGTKKQYACLLLQREIPEWVNLQFATYAKQHDILVLQDVGGEDRIMNKEMMECCDFLMPNLSELQRLVRSLCHDDERHVNLDVDADADIDPTDHNAVVQCAKFLQEHGANHVLVTLGSNGSILVPKHGPVVFQPPCMELMDDSSSAISEPVPVKVVDETGAGDCYRAAFAVALMEHKQKQQQQQQQQQQRQEDDGIGGEELNEESIRSCMGFASVAGALAVTKEGAVPSIPTRSEVDAILEMQRARQSQSQGSSAGESQDQYDDSNNVQSIPRGGKQDGDDDNNDEEFPYMFGSRLNSMKDRPELWPHPVDNVREWVKRQGTIQGLGCVDFNYPQHFHNSWSAAEAKAALDEVGLVAGAVCLRYPSKFARGAMNHPDEGLRREAIDLTKEAAAVARQLGCDEVVVWSAYDGYDYPFQVNYQEKWDQLVKAFQECCDEYPDIKWSLEFKPTDENTRFFTVPSTGAALMLIQEINRPNMGLTMDVGHMLMAGENPAQSISMVGDKMFGIQLNDGYTRLAAEDGMMFGSIHPTMALEIMWQLQETKFSGHLYFDTFPQRTDPVKEAEYNIKSTKRFWRAARLLNDRGIRENMENHDAVGAMEIINSVLKTVE